MHKQCKICQCVLDRGYEEVGLCHRHIDMIDEMNYTPQYYETMERASNWEICQQSFVNLGENIDYEDSSYNS